MAATLEKRSFDNTKFDVDCSALLAAQGSLPSETVTLPITFVVEPATPSPLSFGTPVLNAAPVTYADGHIAAIGQVFQVPISGGAVLSGQASTTYTVRARFTSSGGNAIEATMLLVVRDAIA